MKYVIVAAISLFPLAFNAPAANTNTSLGAPPALSDYAVLERGPHTRLWQRVIRETNDTIGVVAVTNFYTEIASGLHSWDPAAKRWADSNPDFQIGADGFAVASNCQHKVVLNPNINDPKGAVELLTPDGQRLLSSIIGLNLFDPTTGKSVQIAALQDSVGLQTAPNEIVWFNAFQGFNADVRIRNESGQFHQDVLLQEKLAPEMLEKLGFDPDTVQLEAWTEFLDAPNPTVQPVGIKGGSTDDQIEFGTMKFGRGATFLDTEPSQSIHVLKQWQEIGGKKYLVESLNYGHLQPLMQSLPVRTASLKIRQSSSRQLASRSPPQRTEPSKESRRHFAAMLRLPKGRTSTREPQLFS